MFQPVFYTKIFVALGLSLAFIIDTQSGLLIPHICGLTHTFLYIFALYMPRYIPWIWGGVLGCFFDLVLGKWIGQGASVMAFWGLLAFLQRLILRIRDFRFFWGVLVLGLWGIWAIEYRAHATIVDQNILIHFGICGLPFPLYIMFFGHIFPQYFAKWWPLFPQKPPKHLPKIG